MQKFKARGTRQWLGQLHGRRLQVVALMQLLGLGNEIFKRKIIQIYDGIRIQVAAAGTGN